MEKGVDALYEDVKYYCSGLFETEGDWIHCRRTLSDNHEVILVVEGQVHICVNGVNYTLNKDDAILMPANMEHFGWQQSRKVSFHWIHFKDIRPYEPQVFTDTGYHTALLARQIQHFSQIPTHSEEACDYLMRLMLMELYDSADRKKGNRLANKVAEYIRLNSQRAIKMEEISMKFGYNTDYLSRIFRKEFGKSLKGFIDQCRIEKIKTLVLNTSQPLYVIAEQCGFSDYKSFLKYFKRHQGMTLLEFRNTYFRLHMN